MEYKIPLFKLNYSEAEEKAVLEVVRSKWISTGPKNAELEERFASMLGAKYSVAVSSCTSALHLALRALGIQSGDEVIVPSLTFVATVNAVRYVGATPVCCDIKSYEDLTIDPDMVEKLITGKTKALIVMHYAGFPCDMDRIMDISRSHNLKVIEDASHAPLSECGKRKLGTIGDIGCFSFFSNKNISTGEGGMLVTDSETLCAQAKLLRSHGMTTLSYERAKGHATSYDVVELGYNYRMDDIRAALALVQLDKLPDDLTVRARLRKMYIDELSGTEDVIIPFKENREFVANYIFPIVLKDSDHDRREMVRNRLHEAGVQTSVHYPAVHRFSIYQNDADKLATTDYVTDNEITLPLYSALKPEEVSYIVAILKDIVT